MGKAQTKKKTDASRRHNPIRVPDAHLGGGRVEGKNPTKERQLLPVLDKLRSPEASDRSWACAAVCNLIQNDAATRRLFQGRNVVGELIERLSDSADDVVVEAAGALRNLAIDGGQELCGEMYNKGIVPHVITLTGKIGSALESFDSLDGQARQNLVSLAESVITLIWCLAEANHKTLAAINAAGVEGLLTKVLVGRASLNPGLVVAAAQALYALTQDNEPFVRSLLATPGGIDTLVEITRVDHTPLERDLKGKGKGKAKDIDVEFDDGRILLTRLLAAGTLGNIIEPGSKRDTVNLTALTNEVILPLATGLLDVQIPSVVERVGQLVAELPKETVPLSQGVKTDHRPPAELKLERVERALQAVTLSLEILTGLCAGLEDAAEEEGAEGADDAEMEDAQDDEALIAEGRDPATAAQSVAAAKVNSANLPHLLSVLPERLAKLATLTPLSLPPAAEASAHPPSTAALSAVHLRALEALNNLLLSSAAAAQNGEKLNIPSAGLWAALFPILRSEGAPVADASTRGQEARKAIQEAAIGCLWGVAKSASPSAPLTPSAAEEELLTQVVNSSMSVDAQVRAIDTLATLAARPGVSVEENAHIGAWLAGLIIPTLPSQIEITIAALNALIDVYCDETRDFDSNWKYTEPLAKNVARIRGALRSVDKRKQPLLRLQADEVYENLVAFIRWRRSL